jgi:ppGpp synthetase/RelA/SpoT-type nucleotidyltranferase
MGSSSDLTKSQINRLGDRLRTGGISELDLRLLDDYRRSFTEVYEVVVGLIRDQLGLEPTGRLAKSTTSIIDKLRREKTRLSRMQDIAGCRIIVPDILTQDEVVENLESLFDKLTVVDRRENPSHGYRAVHVIVAHSDKLIEVQVRTALQHLWAELSEKLSDVGDSAIKYGGGDQDVVKILLILSELIKRQDAAESQPPDELDPEGRKTQETLIQRLELEQILKSIREDFQ